MEQERFRTEEELKKELKSFNVAGVEFEDGGPAIREAPHKISRSAKWVIGHSGGLIKEEKYANVVLLLFSLVIFIIIYFIVT